MPRPIRRAASQFSQPRTSQRRLRPRSHTAAAPAPLAMAISSLCGSVNARGFGASSNSVARARGAVSAGVMSLSSDMRIITHGLREAPAAGLHSNYRNAEAASEPVVVRATAAFGRDPSDDLIGVGDVAGLAVHAIRSVDLEPFPRPAGDLLHFINRSEEH